MSMRVKAALVIILIVFTITVANFVSSLIFTREGLIEAMEKWQALDRDLADKLVSTQISLLKSNATTVAERLRDARSKEEMIELMKSQLKDFPDFMAFAVFTRDSEVASFGDLPNSVNLLESSPYLKAAFEGKSVISTSRKPAEDDTILVFHVCVPMEGDRVLSVTIPGMLFRNLVAEYRLWETGGIFILDEQGTCLAHYDVQYIIERVNFIELSKTDPTLQSIGEFFEKMISSKEGTGIYSFRDKERVCSYRKISASTVGWTIGVVAPIHESPQTNVQRGLLFDSAFFLVIGVIIAVFLSNAVVLPFRKIEEQNRILEKLNETVSSQAKRIQGEHDRSRVLLNAMPMAAQLWNKDRQIFECNEEMVRMFQLNDKNEFADRFYDFSPEYQPDGQRSDVKSPYTINKAFEEGKCSFEWMHQRLDGTLIPTEVSLVSVKLWDTDVLAVYVRDLREHKAMLAKMREKDEQARMMLDANPQGCQIWDENFGIIDCNTAVVNMFGFKDKQEYIDRFFELLLHQNGLNPTEIAFGHLKAAFETGYQRFETMQQLPDGTPFPCEITLVRIPRENGYLVCGYTRDIRDHKRMMRVIEQRDKLLKAGNSIAAILLTTTNEGLYENSLSESMELIGRCLEVDRVQFWENETFDSELYFALKHQWISDLGQQKVTVPIGLKHPYSQFPDWENLFSRGEYLNGPVSELPQNEQIVLRAAEIDSIVLIPLLLQERFWGFFVLNDCRQERTFSTEEIDILKSAGLLMINAIQRNKMTQNLRDTAVQLEAALEQAREANHAKSVFLANMSHEMRTPLNAVLGLSVLALEDDNLDSESRANIEKIYNSGATLLSTVNDILDISKIEAGKFELIPCEYDVPSLVNDTVIQNMVRIGDKPIEFILDIDGSLSARLFGDELRVKQIFNNLLSNSFKYTMEGTVELSIHCTREEDFVWMTAQIRDTGLGIRREDMEHLFDNYAKLDTKSNRHIEGTGLGLSICKQLAEMMGGAIHVESEYGKGSVFMVRLQQKFVSDTTIGHDLAENLKKFNYSDSRRVQNAKLSRLYLPYATILVVDDIVTNLDVAKGLLKPYSMQIHCVTSGQQAIDAIRERNVRYNAIFMDHMMPGIDGIEATRRIRQIETEYAQNVPIIAMTANAIVGSEQMFLENGFQAFLSKPIDISRLDEIVRHWVRDKEQDKLLADRQIEVEGQKLQDMRSNSDRRGEMDRRSGIDRRILQKIVEKDMDLEKAFQHFGGNMESLLSVLHSFVMHTPALLETIKKVNKDNLADYAITVHGIKGACQGICANDAAEKALLLENAAKSGDFNFVGEHHSEFLESASKLVAHIEAVLAEVDANDSKPQKDKPNTETLVKLFTACENYDMDEVDAAMEKIEEYEYTSDNGLAAWLRQNVDQMNFTQIKEKLSTLVVS